MKLYIVSSYILIKSNIESRVRAACWTVEWPLSVAELPEVDIHCNNIHKKY